MSAFFKSSGSPGASLPWDSPPSTPQRDPELSPAEGKEPRSVPLKMCQVSRKQCPPDTEDRCYMSNTSCFVTSDSVKHFWARKSMRTSIPSNPRLCASRCFGFSHVYVTEHFFPLKLYIILSLVSPTAPLPHLLCSSFPLLLSSHLSDTLRWLHSTERTLCSCGLKTQPWLSRGTTPSRLLLAVCYRKWRRN